jgi:DNA adenine methylase
MSAEPITRPALRWFGGKWRLAPWIIAHFPLHDVYCEPYGGAASVLLRKPPSKIEAYNDLMGRVVNFFTVLRDQPDALIRLIDLTPYAHTEYLRAREQSDDPVEDARRFYVCAGQGRAGGASRATRSGWRREVEDNRRGSVTDEFSDIGHLWAVAQRLKHVQVECEPALSVIQRYNRSGTLLYVDPPYPLSTRSAQWDRYSHEMTEADHHELAEVLHDHPQMVVLSSYPGLLYRELYGDWAKVQCRALTDNASPATEALWFNPAAAAALDGTRHRQLTLGESA